MRSSLVHRNAVRAVGAGFFPELVSIEENQSGQDEWGQPIDNWVVVEGLERVWSNIGTSSGGEVYNPNNTVLTKNQTILLRGAFPDIKEAWRVVDSQGFVYDIILVTVSEFGLVTQLLVRRVTT